MVAPNITPDRETGIGAWTDDEFDNARADGIGADGARLYPAMPYPYYTKMTREDVIAIRAYLDTMQPVHNEVQSNQLPFPFNIRARMRRLGLRCSSIARRVQARIRTNRPNGIAAPIWCEGLGHCGTCHTPKNSLGGDKTERTLQG